MKSYFLVMFSLTFLCITASDRVRRQMELPSVEVPSHINITYYETSEDGANKINPHYIKIPITGSMYLADIQAALIEELGSGKLTMGMPMTQGQLKSFTIGQYFGPRQDAGMTFEQMEKEFVFWPNNRTER
jgi:hypothetical protein